MRHGRCAAASRRGPFLGRLIKAIARRPSVQWIGLFVDEIHEDLPDRPEGAEWHYAREVRENLADFRKAFASLYGGTHHYDEIFEAILKKLQFKLYMKGSRIERSSVLRNKAAAMGLARGEAIVESGNFGRVAFPNLRRPQYQLKVVRSLDDQVADDVDADRRAVA